MCYINNVYLAKISVRRADGTKRFYYVLRHTEWSKKEKRPIQRYLAYIGVKPTLSHERAQKLAKKLKISLADLRKIKGLKIVET